MTRLAKRQQIIWPANVADLSSDLSVIQKKRHSITFLITDTKMPAGQRVDSF